MTPMPNRILKESICTSEDLNSLDPMAEILFYRLMVNVDDYGCFYGNESIIKSNCFPLKSDDIKCEQVDSWLDELDANGLIIRYFGEDGRKYIKLRKWDKHQQIRAKKRKFPEPPPVCEHLISDDINCNQEQAEDSKCPRNPIQSNPNPIRNPNPNPKPKAPTLQDDGFEKFWDAYPKKSGDIRQAYQEYVFALDSVSQEELLKAIQDQTAATEEDELKYFPSADKWLRNRSWRTRPKTAGKKTQQRTFTPTQFD